MGGGELGDRTLILFLESKQILVSLTSGPGSMVERGKRPCSVTYCLCDLGCVIFISEQLSFLIWQMETIPVVGGIESLCSPGSEVLNLEHGSEPPLRLIKRLQGLTASVRVGLEWSSAICISNKFPG